ncbi:hypothetical protein [Desulfosporosinus youngiae]|nr:hypothetical protein [Desulfosporosinus youngiae]
MTAMNLAEGDYVGAAVNALSSAVPGVSAAEVKAAVKLAKNTD